MSEQSLGSAALILRTDDKQLDSGMSRARRKSAQLSKDFAKVGRSITASLTLPILGLGAAIAKTSLDFEASLSQIVGLVGVADDQVNQWREDILKLGPAVGKGPTELADAMFFITSAGLRGSNALDALTLSAKASAAGLGETKVIADAVTSAMNAYGSEVVSAASATNSLVGAVREGKAEAASIASSLGRVIPLAAEMGVRFDQVNASIATLTRLGSGAEETVTSLNSLLLGIKAPTQQAEEALESMGLSSAGLRKQIREGGLLDVLFQLKEEFDKNDTAATKIFPNIRALKAALGLLGKNAEVTKEIFASLASDTDFLGDAFAAASKTGRFKLDQALSTIKSSLIAIGDVVVVTVVPIFQKFAGFISRVAEGFRALTPQVQGMIVKAALLVAALGPALLILSGLTTVIGLLFSPITIIIGLLVALGFAAKVVVDKIKENWDTIVSVTSKLYVGMRKWLVDKVGPVFTWLVEKIKAFQDTFAAIVKTITLGKVDLTVLKNSVVTGVKETADAAAAVTSTMKDNVTDGFADMKDGVKAILASMFKDTSEGFKKTEDDANASTDSMAQNAEGSAARIKAAFGEAIIELSTLLNLFADSVGTVFSVLTEGAQAVADVKAANSQALTDVRVSNAEAVAEVEESNAKALANVTATDAAAMADVVASNAAAMVGVRASNDEALANVIESNATALASAEQSNVDALKGIAIKVLDLFEGVIIAAAATNKAVTLAIVPGTLFGILAALAALEGAKAAVRNVKFGQGGVVTSQGALITASNATANIAEAGRDEGVLPLTRLPSGDLGVGSVGGGGGSTTYVINIADSVIGTKRAIREMIEPVIADMSKNRQSKLTSRR